MKAEAPPQPLAHMQVAADGAAARATALRMAGEFALQRNHADVAAAKYAEAAALSDDPAVTRRALALAYAARDPVRAADMIERWHALGATSHDLAGARARLAMLRGDRAAAEAQFAEWLSTGGADAWKTFGADLLAARDSALAGRILEDLAKPERLPPHENVWVALSQLAEHLGRHAFARQLADGAVDRFGGTQAIRWAANLRLAAGDSAGALALYARGLKAHPHAVDLRLDYAAALGKRGQYREALAVLAQGPQTSATWAARIAFAARAHDEPALAKVYAAMQRAPLAQRADNAFLLGQVAELLKHDSQALHWYGEVDPDGRHAFEARVRTAVLLDKSGHRAEAHTLAMQLQQEYRDDPESLRTAVELDAQLYSRQGEHAQAIAAYDRGLGLLPDDPVLIYDRGIEQASAGNTDAALADFRHVLQLKPDSVEAMNALGFTLADADRDLEEATDLLRRALAAKPDDAAIMDSWGWLQYRLGHFETAESWLRRAWDKDTDADVGVHLGEVLWKLGKQHAAREVFARVRKIDPHNPTLRRVEKELQP